MPTPISKIQFLTDSRTGQPILYCKKEDRDHNPRLEVRRLGTKVCVESRSTLFKVKENPPTNIKNRVDIYMDMDEARALGELLGSIAGCGGSGWKVTTADPNGARRGGTELPHIEWQRVEHYANAAAKTDSGLRMNGSRGAIYVDLEYPHPSHIKMSSWEIHIGILLAPPCSDHDPDGATPAYVPEDELQNPRGRAPERNPVMRVMGDFYCTLTPARAAGLGDLLRNLVPPAVPTVRAEG